MERSEFDVQCETRTHDVIESARLKMRSTSNLRKSPNFFACRFFFIPCAMSRRASLVFAFCAAAFVLSGCSSTGTQVARPRVGAPSVIPPAAAEGSARRTTAPVELSLARGKDGSITAERGGTQSAATASDENVSSWVTGNVLVGGLIGLGIEKDLDTRRVGVSVAPLSVTESEKASGKAEARP